MPGARMPLARTAASLISERWRLREMDALAQATPEPERAHITGLEIASRAGLVLDPWQTQFLTGDTRQVLITAARQTGKSSVASILTIETAMNEDASLQIILSPSDEQSKRFFQAVKTFYSRVGRPVEAEAETMHQLTLENGSRIIALSSNPKTVRGLANVRRIFIDEAAYVSDELYLAVRPMLAISHGDLVAMSTPNAEMGWFYEAWIAEDADPGTPSWMRYLVTAEECPRYTQAFLADERRKMPKFMYEREYQAKFTAPPGQLFPTDLVMGAFHPEIEPLFDVPADAQGVMTMQPSWVSEDEAVKPLFEEDTLVEQMEQTRDTFEVWPAPGENR